MNSAHRDGAAAVSDGLTQRVIHAIILVHQTLGPGFIEKVYNRALHIELCRQGLAVERERKILVMYAGQVVGTHYLDLVVDGSLILELKTVEALSRAHYAQVRSYLAATHLRKALLINFASDRADFRRIEIT